MQIEDIKQIISQIQDIDCTRSSQKLTAGVSTPKKRNPKIKTLTLNKNSYDESKITVNLNAGLYEGESRKDEFSGIGYLFSLEGFEYFGEFKNGLKNGNGQLRSPEFKVRGQFLEDQLIGYFKLTLRSGKTIKGKINESGQLDQFIDLEDPIKGTKIAGSFRNGEAQGFVEIISKRQSYAGTLKEGLKHGVGVLITKEVQYKGFWMEDEMDHFGTILKENYLYTGQLNQGARQGIGKEIDEISNKTYLGLYENNVKHGLGMSQGKQGIYFGEWKNGKQNGTGLLMMEDNSYYLGQWRKGRQRGYGVYVRTQQGKVVKIRGEWKNGILHGKAHVKTGNKKGKLWFYDKGSAVKVEKYVNASKFLKLFKDYNIDAFFPPLKKRFDEMFHEINAKMRDAHESMMKVYGTFNRSLVDVHDHNVDVNMNIKDLLVIHNENLINLYKQSRRKRMNFVNLKEKLMQGPLAENLEQMEESIERVEESSEAANFKSSVGKLEHLIQTANINVGVDGRKYVQVDFAGAGGRYSPVKAAVKARSFLEQSFTPSPIKDRRSRGTSRDVGRVRGDGRFPSKRTAGNVSYYHLDARSISRSNSPSKGYRGQQEDSRTWTPSPILPDLRNSSKPKILSHAKSRSQYSNTNRFIRSSRRDTSFRDRSGISGLRTPHGHDLSYDMWARREKSRSRSRASIDRSRSKSIRKKYLKSENTSRSFSRIGDRSMAQRSGYIGTGRSKRRKRNRTKSRSRKRTTEKKPSKRIRKMTRRTVYKDLKEIERSLSKKKERSREANTSLNMSLRDKEVLDKEKIADQVEQSERAYEKKIKQIEDEEKAIRERVLRKRKSKLKVYRDKMEALKKIMMFEDLLQKEEGLMDVLNEYKERHENVPFPVPVEAYLDEQLAVYAAYGLIKRTRRRIEEEIGGGMGGTPDKQEASRAAKDENKEAEKPDGDDSGVIDGTGGLGDDQPDGSQSQRKEPEAGSRSQRQPLEEVREVDENRGSPSEMGRHEAEDPNSPKKGEKQGQKDNSEIEGTGGFGNAEDNKENMSPSDAQENAPEARKLKPKKSDKEKTPHADSEVIAKDEVREEPENPQKISKFDPTESGKNDPKTPIKKTRRLNAQKVDQRREFQTPAYKKRETNPLFQEFEKVNFFKYVLPNSHPIYHELGIAKPRSLQFNQDNSTMFVRAESGIHKLGYEWSGHTIHQENEINFEGSGRRVFDMRLCTRNENQGEKELVYLELSHDLHGEKSVFLDCHSLKVLRALEAKEKMKYTPIKLDEEILGHFSKFTIGETGSTELSSNLLWMFNLSEVFLYQNLDKPKIIKFENFWEKRKPEDPAEVRPISLIYSDKLNVIYGLSKDNHKKKYNVHKYDIKQKKAKKFALRSIYNQGQSYHHLALSKDQNIIFLTSTLKLGSDVSKTQDMNPENKSSILAIEFEEQAEDKDKIGLAAYIDDFKIKVENFGQIQAIKRMPSQDILGVIGRESFVLVEFNTEENVFGLRWYFDNIFKGSFRTVDFVFGQQNIFVLGDSEIEGTHQGEEPQVSMVCQIVVEKGYGRTPNTENVIRYLAEFVKKKSLGQLLKKAEEGGVFDSDGNGGEGAEQEALGEGGFNDADFSKK